MYTGALSRKSLMVKAYSIKVIRPFHEALADKAHELAAQAREVLSRAADPASVWRAYVAVEYAILDVKLRNGLENEQPPAAPKRTAKTEDLLAVAKEKLERLDPSDKKKLLYDLRQCRDALKAILARA
jgi:hypothetical protein